MLHGPFIPESGAPHLHQGPPDLLRRPLDMGFRGPLGMLQGPPIPDPGAPNLHQGPSDLLRAH